MGDLAFNWQREFPEVFEQGGFDIVIGNPPYGVNFDSDTKKYLDNFDYKVPDYEIYIYFISLYKKILSKNGYLSYIFPNTFLSNLFAKDYRKYLIENTNILEISDLSNDEVFKDAKVRTIILLLKNNNSNKNIVIFNKSVNGKIEYFEKYKYDDILNNVENISSMFLQSKEEKNIIYKIKNNYMLKDYRNISQGLIPYDKYRGQSEHIIKNRAYHSDKKLNDTYKKELKGEDIKSYYLSWNGNLWISYGEWLAAPREPKYFLEPRILIREITGDKLFCVYTEEEYYNTPSIINVINNQKDLELKYILGILNSKLIGGYHNKTSPKANKGLFPKILVNDVKNIPIKVTNYSNQKEIILYIDKMISLNKNYYERISKFINFVKNKFNIEKISKKLSNWYILEFSYFIKEMKKAKIKFSLAEELEWQQFFEDEKNKIIIT